MGKRFEIIRVILMVVVIVIAYLLVNVWEVV